MTDREPKEHAMGELHMTRRAILAVLASTATLGSATTVLAAAWPDGQRFREIRVDVSPLRARGEGESAAWVAAVLQADLQKSFAKYLAPGDRSAGVLVARIDNVVLGDPHPGMGSGMLGSDSIDGIEGDGLALDARGRVVGTYPLYSTVGADSFQGLPYQDDIRRRRVETLALSFAQWLPGQMGL
jgi:hypothetical protein